MCVCVVSSVHYLAIIPPLSLLPLPWLFIIIISDIRCDKDGGRHNGTEDKSRERKERC